jgi:hypothetical protein
MLLDGTDLLKYLKYVRQDMSRSTAREIDYIIEEIEAGTFNEYELEDYFINRIELLTDIMIERKRQDWMHEFPENIRMAVLAEEVGEVASSLQSRKNEDLENELIQVAAVAIRWVEFLRSKKYEHHI